jgi:hypothetical protein
MLRDVTRGLRCRCRRPSWARVGELRLSRSVWWFVKCMRCVHVEVVYVSATA